MQVTINTDDPELRAMVEKMVADAGGPEAFLKQEAEHDELFRQLLRQEKSLRQQYPDQFVAIAPGDVLVVGDTMEEVRQRLDEKGIARGKACTMFLDVNTGPLVV